MIPLLLEVQPNAHGHLAPAPEVLVEIPWFRRRSYNKRILAVVDPVAKHPLAFVAFNGPGNPVEPVKTEWELVFTWSPKTELSFEQRYYVGVLAYKFCPVLASFFRSDPYLSFVHQNVIH